MFNMVKVDNHYDYDLQKDQFKLLKSTEYLMSEEGLNSRVTMS